jgi:hypothetical protein
MLRIWLSGNADRTADKAARARRPNSGPTGRGSTRARSCGAVNRPETIPVRASRLSQRQRGMPRMSIFNHPHAIAASKCASCRHLEVIIADLQAWVDDLRQSRDRWRELALDAKRIADFAEHAAAEAA